MSRTRSMFRENYRKVLKASGNERALVGRSRMCETRGQLNR